MKGGVSNISPRRMDEIDAKERGENEEDDEVAGTPFDEEPEDDDIDLPAPAQRRISPQQSNQRRAPMQQQRPRRRELVIVKELPVTAMKEGMTQDGTPVSFMTMEDAIKEILLRLRNIDRPKINVEEQEE